MKQQKPKRLTGGLYGLLLACAVLPAAAFAQDLSKVQRPKHNPNYLEQSVGATDGGKQSADAAPAPVAVASAMTVVRPKHRPAALEQKVTAVRAAIAEPKGGLDLTNLRPKARPQEQLAAVAQPQSRRKESKREAPVSTKGSVCGVAAIKGQKIAPIGSKVQGCGLSDGVRVTQISGVRLSMAITVDCDTAKALNTWVERVAQPAYGGKIVELKIAGHYVCRPRNNKKGAKVSEHGRGKAVDISGITLSSGKTHMVLRGFDQTMRRAYKGACGIFGTTLGPGSDGYHEDHLHFDTAANRRGGGAYCR